MAEAWPKQKVDLGYEMPARGLPKMLPNLRPGGSGSPDPTVTLAFAGLALETARARARSLAVPRGHRTLGLQCPPQGPRA